MNSADDDVPIVMYAYARRDRASKIGEQLCSCEELIRNHGFSSRVTIFADISNRKDRPGLDCVRKIIEIGNNCILVVKDSTRISRDAAELLEFMTTAAAHHVPVLFVDGADSSLL